MLTAVVSAGVATYVWRDGRLKVIPDRTTASPVLSIFRTGRHHQVPLLNFAIWNDGRIVWRPVGREELLTKNVGPQVVNKLFADLSNGRLLDPSMKHSYGGPNESYDTIEIATDKNGIITLSSWHESLERHPNLVCTDGGGVTSVEPGKTKQDYIDTWSRGYRLFRNNWEIIQNTTRPLIVKDGSPFLGDAPKSFSQRIENAE